MCRMVSWCLFLLQSFAGITQTVGGSISDLNVVNSLSGVHDDIFSTAVNPAALAGARKSGISVYGERKFLLKELSGYDLLGGIVTSSGNFGLGMQIRGSEFYREIRTGLFYARKLAEQLEAGAEIHFVSISMDGYGKVSVPGFGLGLRFHPNEKLHIGISAVDPVSKSFGKDDSESLPFLYTMGVGFEPSRNFLLALQVNKEENRPVEAGVLIQYFPVDAFCVRGVIGLFNQTAGLAVGWRSSSRAAPFRIFVSSYYHFQLGLTPGIQLQYELSKKQG